MFKDLDIYSNLKVKLQKTFSYFIIVKKWKDKKKLILKILKTNPHVKVNSYFLTISKH